jgi:hypothetical protein
MDTEHDQKILLRREDFERDVIETRDFGNFQVQLLEGPSDCPIRVLAPSDPGIRERFDFAIEGSGWNILVDILKLPGWRGDHSTTPYHLSCLIAVVRKFPRSFDLLEDPSKVFIA